MKTIENPIWESYQQIVWDWNGTLLNDLDVCVEIINRSLDKRSLPLVDRNAYLEIFEFPVINYYRKLGFDFEKESFEAVGLEFIQAYSTRMFECQLQSGARAVLDKIKNSGSAQFILSALQLGALRKIVAHYELGSYFTGISGLDDHYAWGKVELGKRLLAESSKPGARTLMIGDTLHDFETAQALGIDCVLFDAGHNSRQRLETCGVPVISSLSALMGR